MAEQLTSYDVERREKKDTRARLACDHGITLQDVEDQLSTMQGSAYDRRVAKRQLVASRARLGW